MGNEVWEKITIGELIRQGVIVAHKDGNHGSNYPRGHEFGDEGIPFLSAKLLSDSGTIDFSSAPRLNYRKASKIKFGYIQEGDVLLSHNATVGRIAVVPSLKEDVLIGTSLTHFRLDSTRLLPNYLAAYFKGRDFQNQLSAFMGGMSTRNQVPITAQRCLEVVVPPMKEQKRISKVLGSLDKKIELNRQTNQTLEQMAQALFKSWFVDFDPVIDNALAAGNDIPEELQQKAEQRKKAQQLPDFKLLPDDIRALFPSEFEQTDDPNVGIAGWMPKNWKTPYLYDLGDFINGAAYKKFEPNKNGVGLPIIKIAELKGGITANTGFSTVKMPDKYLLADRDILFSWSGNPDTSIDTFVWSNGDAWLNQHIFKVVPNEECSYSFLLSLLRYLKPVFSAIAKDKQTTGLGHVTVKDLKKLVIPLPQIELIRAFDQQTLPIYDRAFLTKKNTTKLEQIRDYLLPKLISGKIKVNKEVA